MGQIHNTKDTLNNLLILNKNTILKETINFQIKISIFNTYLVSEINTSKMK